MRRVLTLTLIMLLSMSLPLTVSAGKLGKRLAVAGAAVGGKIQHDKKKNEKKEAKLAAAAELVVTCPKLPDSKRTPVLITDVHTDGGPSEPSGEQLVNCGYTRNVGAKTYTAVLLQGEGAGTEIYFRSTDENSDDLKGMCRSLKYLDGDVEKNDNPVRFWGHRGTTGCEELITPWLASSGRVPDEAFQNEALEMMELGSREYIFMEMLWPAFEVYKERAKNPSQKPNYKGAHFDRVCENTFNKDDNALAKKWKKSFGYERCGNNDDNFYKVLSWFDRETKDYSATADWLDFSFESPDKLTRPIFTDAHKNIWLMAYRFNMYVAAELADEKARAVLVPHYRSAFERSIASHRRYATNLFDVNSLDDVKEKAKRLDLYPEEITYYASLLDDPEEYAGIIGAFIDNADTGLTPDESKFETLYENFALVGACYNSRKSMMRPYISYDQYKAAQQKYKTKLSELNVSRGAKKEITTEIDRQVATTQQALTVNGWDDFANSACEAALFFL